MRPLLFFCGGASGAAAASVVLLDPFAASFFGSVSRFSLFLSRDCFLSFFLLLLFLSSSDSLELDEELDEEDEDDDDDDDDDDEAERFRLSRAIARFSPRQRRCCSVWGLPQFCGEEERRPHYLTRLW